MPIYEYICDKCQKKVSVLLRAPSSQPLCPQCGGSGLTRVISSFAIHKSLSTIYEQSGTPGGAESPDYYKDPRNIGRSLEKRLREANIEMPPEIQKTLAEAREGKLPDSLKELDSAAPDSAYS